MRLAGLFMATLTAGATGAGAAEGTLSAELTGGSGYRAFRLGAEARGRPLSGGVAPFGGVRYASDDFARDLTLEGGASKRLTPLLSGRLGAGASAGRARATGERVSSFSLEAALDRELSSGAAGLGLRHSAGRLGAAGGLRGPLRRRLEAETGPKGTGGETFRFTEASAWAGRTAGRLWLEASLAAGFPSVGGTVLTETASVSVPVGPDASMRGALGFEQGGPGSVYVSLGAALRLGSEP